MLKETDEEAVLLDALDGVREETREAVRIGKVSKLERVLDTYLSLLKTFLEQISTYGIHYDSKTARSELGFGWRQIFEIRRSLEQAVELAFKHDFKDNPTKVAAYVTGCLAAMKMMPDK